MSSKSLTPSQLRKFRGDVARLKSKGLVSKHVDARAQKPTRHMLAQVKKFDDVLKGRAKVVSTKATGSKKDGTRKSAVENARSYENVFTRKGKHLVVPAMKNEQVRFDPRSGEVKAYGTSARGDRYSKVFTPRAVSGPGDFPTGPGILYRIPFGTHGAAFTFDNQKDLFDFMRPYEQSAKPFKDWQRYVEIIRINPRKLELGGYLEDDDAA